MTVLSSSEKDEKPGRRTRSSEGRLVRSVALTRKKETGGHGHIGWQLSSSVALIDDPPSSRMLYRSRPGKRRCVAVSLGSPWLVVVASTSLGHGTPEPTWTMHGTCTAGGTASGISTIADRDPAEICASSHKSPIAYGRRRLSTQSGLGNTSTGRRQPPMVPRCCASSPKRLLAVSHVLSFRRRSLGTAGTKTWLFSRPGTVWNKTQ